MALPLVVLTGAAGKIGSRTRKFLRGKCHLRSSDIVEFGEAEEGEEVVRCDLSDIDATRALLQGAAAVVHLAGIPREAPIADIASANLTATWNLYQAAQEQGIRRVVFGSTNHVVGFYGPEDRLGVDALPRPDTLYGASKVFGEAVARLQWDKHGIESVCLRIGSALEKPSSQRHLSTWISYDDLNRLIWSSLTAERVGYTVAYGVSDNRQAWWSNDGASHLGYVPLSKAQDFSADLISTEKLPHLRDITAPATRFQGGPWAADGYSLDRGQESS
jgi:uronate dehydrogenase